MAEYHFTLHHLEGKKNAGADALSRRPDHDDGSEDNKDIAVLPGHLFRQIEERPLSSIEKTIMEEVEEQSKGNREWSKLKKKFQGEWKEGEEGVRYWRERVYVPKGNIRERILKEYHDTALAGHPGRHRMYENIFRTFWWPTIRKDINTYVEGCPICQKTRINTRPPPTTLQPSEVPTRAWQRISVDLIGPLPRSRDHNCKAVTQVVKHKGINSRYKTIQELDSHTSSN